MLRALNTKQRGHVQPSDPSFYKISVQPLLSVTHVCTHAHTRTHKHARTKGGKKRVSSSSPWKSDLLLALATQLSLLSFFIFCQPRLYSSLLKCLESEKNKTKVRPAYCKSENKFWIKGHHLCQNDSDWTDSWGRRHCKSNFCWLRKKI